MRWDKLRITNKMLSDNFLSDVNRNLQNMQKLQQQMTSGKEISKPSDDPFKVARTMQLNSDIDANNQYNSNITDSINTLSTADTALGQAGEVLKRIKELLISTGNAGYSQDQKTAIKNEINQRISQFSQILNTNFDGKYLFGGSRGSTRPTSTVQELNLSSTLPAGSTSTGVVSGTYSGPTGSDLQVKIGSIDATGKVTSVSYSKDGTTWTAATQVNAAAVDPAEFDIGNGVRAHFNTNTSNAVGDTVDFKPDDLAKSGNTRLVYYNNDNNTTNPELITTGGANSNVLDQINKSLNVEISQGVTIGYSSSVGDLLQFTDESGKNVDLRDLFSNIVNHLDGKTSKGTTPSSTDPSPATQLITSDEDGITNALNNLLSVRSQIGAKENAMSSAKDKNTSDNANLTEVLSSTEDIDITKKTIEYTTAQTVYMACLSTSARVMQPTLLDYLK